MLRNEHHMLLALVMLHNEHHMLLALVMLHNEHHMLLQSCWTPVYLHKLQMT